MARESTYQLRMEREARQKAQAEAAFRQQMDAYLESQGLLKYQTGGEGPTQAQLLAAGVPVYNAQPSSATPPLTPQNYTITDTDTIATIATQNGTTPESILQANPSMRNPQTGMVIRVPGSPAPGSEAWRAGLPSNANLGTLTTNQQGQNAMQVQRAGEKDYTPTSMIVPGSEAWRAQNIKPYESASQSQFQQGMLAYSQARSQQSRAINQTYVDPRGNIIEGNPFWQSAYTVPGTGAPAQPVYANTYNTMSVPTQISPAVQTPESMRNAQEIQRETGRGELGARRWVADPWSVGQMVQTVQAAPAYLGGGGRGRSTGYGGGGRYGGGGGGGGVKYPTFSPGSSYVGNNAPAFSSNGGFRGLVNWRI